ncbi:MAG: TetR/AcrR family transcriptional regulator [Bacteriovoracia bacterium]
MSQKPQDLDTSARLMAAATDVFSEKGFGGATVKEIADRAGVNISLISYHFNGKEGLFRACLEKFGRERLLHAERILTAPENVEDLKAKLKLWMMEFLQCHVEEKSVCGILHRENVIEHKFMWEVFQNTFLKAFEANAKFFEAGKKKGIVKKEIDPMLMGAIVFGTLIHLGRSQEIQKVWMGVSIESEKYRAQVTEQFVMILLNGIT